MPGEFYIKGKKEKTDLSQVLAGITQLEAAGDAIKARTDNLAGEAPETGSTVADWQAAESDIISLGANDTRYKLHSLLLSIHNLVGTVITVRLYTKINGVERKVYEQTFNAATDPPGTGRRSAATGWTSSPCPTSGSGSSWVTSQGTGSGRRPP